ncbi:DUF4124 domain-containing protein [Chitinilyticum aquatile]|uniref:DUF4124 domain-containing protein n=1 Tax=Chitinilyticum aquatile TaxID=362520 RepID=UPI0003FE7F9D|nr:DUF4124 domain-containing protein [Chitinilyticum aquatile]
MKRTGWLLLLCVLAAGAQAQIYTWKDEKGVVHYSDQPPAGKTSQAKVVNTKDAPVSAVSAQGAKPAAPAAAAPASQAASAPAEKKDPNSQACVDARKRLAFLQGSKLYRNVSNDKGQMEFIDEKKKQDEIRTTNEFLSKNCQ